MPEITDFHAKYYAHALSVMGGKGLDRIGRALFDSAVTPNPYQIEAALFALRSPLSQGVMLADEVGLGKTIEAGIVLCQYWAERKRRLLVICPASLRTQWAQEMSEKFGLPCLILDAKKWRELVAQGATNPFERPEMVICSMHFASAHRAQLEAVVWDLTVIDEAHKLRNVYNQSSTIAHNIRDGLRTGKRILLTATPLQNSLVELYGLSTLIDPNLFGSLAAFKARYEKNNNHLSELQHRLRAFVWRTLRSQVQEYVRFTERKLMTRPFLPTEQEHQLYEAVSAYLQREETYAFPSSLRQLLVMLVRKLLASSAYALAGTLERVLKRLRTMREEYLSGLSPEQRIATTDDWDVDTLEELLEDEEDNLGEFERVDEAEEREIDLAKLDAEIVEVERYLQWARNIVVDTKVKELVIALRVGFERMVDQGGARKAVIFTESQRTQMYLRDHLLANGYDGKGTMGGAKVITFNGNNNDPSSQALYARWKGRFEGTVRSSGSQAVDVRTAILDAFREDAEILIATEAAAEGINLQFCSLVVNFDLPWNPQRIEQRIGRCHRYGQEHDVVVINFLNERNEADRHVHFILERKFQLFSGVFGASDQVLGALAGGLDFERRVLEIYQRCRRPAEIQAAFTALQAELDEVIQDRMEKTRQLLIEHFDADVHARLNINVEGTQERLDQIGTMFWRLTNWALVNHATVKRFELAFELHDSPVEGVATGKYHLVSRTVELANNQFLYRIGHPLGEFVLEQGRNMPSLLGNVCFQVSGNPVRMSMLEPLKGLSGWLRLTRLTVSSFEKQEYLLFSGYRDDGKSLDQEVCEKLFMCLGESIDAQAPETPQATRLEEEAERHVKGTLHENLEENNRHYHEIREQLDKWAEDRELAAEQELDMVRKKIKELQRSMNKAKTLEEQHAMQSQVDTLEKEKRRMRQNIFKVEDEIGEKRRSLLEALETRMKQRSELVTVFELKWTVI